MTNEPATFGRGTKTSLTNETSQSAQQNSKADVKETVKAKSPKKVGRSRQSRNIFVVFGHFVMTCLVVGVLGAGGVAFYGKSQFEKPGPTNIDRTFDVPESSALGGISTRLYTNGFITDDRVFQMAVRASGNGAKLKAGEFEIPAQASMRQIMDILVKGRAIEYAVTIPEGWTVEQAWQRIAENPALEGPMPEQKTEEGWLLANTWTFPRGTTRIEVVAELEKRQKALVEEIWATRADDLPVKDINEFVTLASIVEKETALAAERPRVASVFVNRLRKGMRLQSDPTIIYGIFGGAGKPSDRPIYKSDIEKPTPYNTYTIDALPPGPIANPGRASLEAVANPLTTTDIYFVADGTGGHAFAETLDEHNANVRLWREIERKREEAAKAAQ